MSLDALADRLVSTFAGRETERNWEKLDGLLREYAAKTAADSIPSEDVLGSTRRCRQVIQDTLDTERTRLALGSLAAVAAVAKRLQSHYDPLQEFFIDPILRLCERTNRVLSERAKATLLQVLQACPTPAKVVLAKLQEGQQSANKSLRHSVFEALHVLLQSLPREAWLDHLDVLQRMLLAGLQDAAEPVRAISRQIYTTFAILFPHESASFFSSLPTTVLKTLHRGGVADAPAVGLASAISRPNFKTFLSSARREGAKAGPQRVTSKLPNAASVSFHPYAPPPSAAAAASSVGLSASQHHHLSPQKTMASRSTEQLRPPSRISRPPTSASIPSHPAQRPARISTSASMGHLGGGLGATRAPTALPHPTASPCPIREMPLAVIGQEATPQGMALAATLGASSSLSLSEGAIISASAAISPRSILATFRSHVTHPDWNTRQRALQEFAAALRMPEVAEYIGRSQSKTLELFDLLNRGIKDGHHQVIAASLELGRQLLQYFPPSKHANLAKFSSLLVFNLHAILTNIQLKARTAMLADCRALIKQMADWLDNPATFLHSLFGAIQIHDHLGKTRVPILQTAIEAIKGRDALDPIATKETIEFIRRNGAWFYDRDSHLVSAMNDLVLAASPLIATVEILQSLPESMRASWSKRLSLDSGPEAAQSRLDSPLLETNPITLSAPTLHSSPKHRGNSDDHPQQQADSSLPPSRRHGRDDETHPLAIGSPMKGVCPTEAETCSATASTSPASQASGGDPPVIVLDAELGISLRLRHHPDPPATPLRTPAAIPIIVDFATPRSMDHQPASSSEAEEEGELVGDTIQDYDGRVDNGAAPAEMVGIERLDLES